jgi:hypothetical protein
VSESVGDILWRIFMNGVATQWKNLHLKFALHLSHHELFVEAVDAG